MFKRIFFTLLLVVLPLPAYAGQGTILETDTAIIVEYTGNEEEIKAGRIMKEQEEKVREAEEDKKIKLEEKHAQQRAKSSERKAASEAAGENE